MIPASQPVQFPALPLLCSLLLLLTGPESRAEDQDAPPRNCSIPLLDLSDDPTDTNHRAAPTSPPDA
ncbi:MAG: hypothetical protein ACKVKH_16390 [Verrucomicrobiales bacterium]